MGRKGRMQLHADPNEQSGYVIFGKYRTTVSGEEEILAASVSHAREVVPAGEAVGVSPVDGEYL